MENQTGTQKKQLPDRTYQPAGISLTRTQIPLSGRAIEAIKELKGQDLNSYLYLLMEDMLFAAAESHLPCSSISKGYLRTSWSLSICTGNHKCAYKKVSHLRVMIFPCLSGDFFIQANLDLFYVFLL